MDRKEKVEIARSYIPQLRLFGRRNRAWGSLITSMCNAFDAALTAEPEPCEDAQWWTCPDCGARYPITPIEKLGDEEYDGPTQYFVSQGELRTPLVYGSRPVICACKLTHGSDKRIEEMQHMVRLVLQDEKKLGGISRFRLMGLLPPTDDNRATTEPKPDKLEGADSGVR